ncbi:succinate dehydrogenase cytochrome b subunit [Sanyastnella coralliicola]|uniref:succinate dehydrogenase cytochrome b subunit n=1 Tax=Sanyastnella coralliicola TaxID=3069118 RepID=UPI0027B8B1E2|nr:succinate dehydrogenase cytochrome b subunit [Longitalea sp. SCSIO 12813]
MSRSAILKSSLVKKYWMALTGLFLCLFLVGHLVGNLQLFIPGMEGQLQFNEYAKFMTSNPAVKILSYVTYFSILFHAIDGIKLTFENRKARPVKYAYNKPGENSGWASRNMALLGTVLLAFIATHMTNFWAKMHFSEMPMQTVDAEGAMLMEPLKDLHTVVLAFFNPAVNSMALVAMLFYVISMIAIAFHLWHGFQSAWQTLGVNHKKYTPLIKLVGKGFSVLVPLLFAVIPIYLYITQA